jgi:hypothetical protein
VYIMFLNVKNLQKLIFKSETNPYFISYRSHNVIYVQLYLQNFSGGAKN